MTKVANPARERLERGEVSLGVGIRISRTVDMAKAMRVAGFHWLFLDLEHGTMPLDVAAQFSVAAIDAGIAPIVRVPKGDYTMATRLLDGGALGIVVPHVDSAAEAADIVSRLKFPPVGHRSVGPVWAPLDYGAVSIKEHTEVMNAATLVVVMIESPDAVQKVDEIVSVPGIDIALIGSSDLSAELGIPGEFEHPLMVDAYEKVIAACRRHGKFPGMGGIYHEPIMAKYIEMGARFILSGSDFAFLFGGAKSRASFLTGVGG
jgi:4-hydroxy-2-oxoheptanedioate aldolase